MNKRLLSTALVAFMIFLLCGFSFNRVTVMVDTEKNHVYEYVSVDDLLDDFAKDAADAEKQYKNGYYVVSGKVEGVSKNGDKVNITGLSAAKGHIIASCPKSLRTDAVKLVAGAAVGVFGRISVDLFDKEIHIEAGKLTSSLGPVKSGTFYLLDGAYIEKNVMTDRTLDGGTVSFKIPPAWKGVEHSIVKEGLGAIDGYQYILNKLPGSTDTVPEAFFVCYFDNATRLENADDRKETAEIEKAIINNISGNGKASSFRKRNVTTYYGAKYDYYVGSYTDALDAWANGYHAEYIFQKNGDKGLVMYLYVYKNARHLSDVMFVTRLLEYTGDS